MWSKVKFEKIQNFDTFLTISREDNLQEPTKAKHSKGLSFFIYKSVHHFSKTLNIKDFGKIRSSVLPKLRSEQWLNFFVSFRWSCLLVILW